MKRSIFLYCMVTCYAALALYGCISVSTSPSPRFYMLSPIDKNQVSQKFDMPPDIIITVGPVKIPEYQNRPQIVTQDKDRMVMFSQFHRWGESLDLGLERLVFENLVYMLPGTTLKMFPCNYAIPADYQIIVDVIQLESELDKDLFMSAQWSLIDLQSKKMLVTKRAELRQPIDPHDYSGLVRALNTVGVSLSIQIAETTALLVNQKKTKDNAPASK